METFYQHKLASDLGDKYGKFKKANTNKSVVKLLKDSLTVDQHKVSVSSSKHEFIPYLNERLKGNGKLISE